MPGTASRHDWYKAAALALRDRIVHRWLTADKKSYDAGAKRVYYLSLEFLIGRLFSDALNNMGLLKVFETALGDLGVSLADLRKCEPDAALGNGGLGRLAACFMDSMATLAIPAIGYGIRYDFGLFREVIAQGWQQEYPDEWLSFGNPWEFQRPEVVYHVHFGGGVEHVEDKGRDRAICNFLPVRSPEAPKITMAAGSVVGVCMEPPQVTANFDKEALGRTNSPGSHFLLRWLSPFFPATMMSVAIPTQRPIDDRRPSFQPVGQFVEAFYRAKGAIED